MFTVLKEAAEIFRRHGGRQLAGATAFYALLSVAPILALALRVARLFAPERAARAEVGAGFARFFGEDVATTVDRLVATAAARPPSISLEILNILILGYGATRLFAQLQHALNTMWGVTAEPVGSFWAKLFVVTHKRIASFVMVVVVGIVLVFFLMTKTLLTAATTHLIAIDQSPWLWHSIESLSSFLVVAALFAAVFKILPDTSPAWKDVIFGALLTSMLFTLGTTLIGLYLGNKTIAQAFGAAGSVVLLLLWVHYTAQIFYFGAAVTWCWARHAGRVSVQLDVR